MTPRDARRWLRRVPCLRCGVGFRSAWPGRRLCDDCYEDAAWLERGALATGIWAGHARRLRGPDQCPKDPAPMARRPEPSRRRAG